MFEFSDNGVRVSAILDTRRKNKHGEFPIKIRVNFQRQRQYYSTGKALSEEDWARLPETRSKQLIDVRGSVQVTVDRVRETVKDLVREDAFSFESLNKRLGRATGDTVNTAFKAREEQLKNDQKINSYELHKYTLRSIEDFAGGNIKFSQVTTDWLQRFEKHLVNKGRSYTTISMYMRTLQKIINDAKACGIVKSSQHPFGKGKYEIPQHDGRSIALKLEDIGRIVDYKCETKAEEMCRDLWLFLYLCNGANITDVCRLRFSNIKDGEICFYRQKTLARSKKKKLIYATLTSEMKSIIDRWGNKSSEEDNYIFPFLNNAKTVEDEVRTIKSVTSLANKKMKHIGAQLGLGSISTYTARHSFATVLKRSGANIAYISESLGHTDLRTTENYLEGFEREERERNAALLTMFRKAA